MKRTGFFLAFEKKESWKCFDSGDDDAASMGSTTSTFDSVQRQDLDLLVTAKAQYSRLAHSPFDPPSRGHKETGQGSSKQSPKSGGKVGTPSQSRQHSGRNVKSGSSFKLDRSGHTFTPPSGLRDLQLAKKQMQDAGFTEGESSQFTPPISGRNTAARGKDFIRCLPVHLSKGILGRLDPASLKICMHVSSNWKVLAQEVQSERHLKQSLHSEIAQLQVS